jgi:small subunit ribosomal protein S21
LEVVIKIEVKDNNIEQALRVLKRKLQRDGFFQENIKRVKKLNKLKNRI